MIIDPETTILGLIDVQPTFMPGGGLAVPEGDRIVPVINRIMPLFEHVFATQDWHKPNHHSFASAHSGLHAYETIELPYGTQILWPDHGIAGTEEAMIHPDIDQTRIELIIRKGFRVALDSYSAFFENDHVTATGLDGWLRQRGFRQLFLCGLATDFCVAWSAEDAARLGYDVTIIEDACRAIALPVPSGGTTDEARAVRTTDEASAVRATLDEGRAVRTTLDEGRAVRTTLDEGRAVRTTMDEARDRLTGLGVRFISSAEPGAAA